MHARIGGATGGAGLGDDLALPDRVALLHQQLVVVAVGGDVAIGVGDQDQIAHATHFAAGIYHAAAIGGLHGRPLFRGDVDAVVLLAATLRAVGRDDPAAHRPFEARRGTRWWRRRHGDRARGRAERRRLAGGGPGGVRRLALAAAGRRSELFALDRTARPRWGGGRRLGLSGQRRL